MPRFQRRDDAPRLCLVRLFNVPCVQLPVKLVQDFNTTDTESADFPHDRHEGPGIRDPPVPPWPGAYHQQRRVVHRHEHVEVVPLPPQRDTVGDGQQQGVHPLPRPRLPRQHPSLPSTAKEGSGSDPQERPQSWEGDWFDHPTVVLMGLVIHVVPVWAGVVVIVVLSPAVQSQRMEYGC